MPAHSPFTPDAPGAAERAAFQRHAPAFAGYTEDVLFGDVWQRPGLSPRDRSLITVAALVALNRVAQLPVHLQRAADNGRSTDGLAEATRPSASSSGPATSAPSRTSAPAFSACLSNTVSKCVRLAVCP